MACCIRALFVLPFLSLAVLALGCSNPSDDENEPPTAEEQAAFCTDLANTRNSIAEVQDALLPLDEVAMQNARADTRASIDYLEGSSLQLQGGADQVEVLKEDIFKLQEILATPSLVSAADDIRGQVGVISTDLDTLEATGGCP
jgi:hypothetical protein